MRMPCYFAVHRRKSDGYLCSCRGRSFEESPPVLHILFTRQDVVHFLLIWSLTLYSPPFLYFYLPCLYWGSIQEMISQREKAQTGTGRFIALAVGHLISAQKVMKSLKWPKQFKFARQFHMPEKVLLCFIGGITCRGLRCGSCRASRRKIK